MNSRERFLAACKCKPCDRPPVWLMRQAGRYLPEYKELRERYSFLDLCKRPELAVETSLMPWKRFGMDAVIVFSDILLPFVPMGTRLSFEEGVGPRLDRKISGDSDVAKLAMPNARTSLSFMLDALASLRHELDDEAALLGFVGAPWTLACYAIQGGSGDFSSALSLLNEQPAALKHLLEHLGAFLCEFAVEQVRAGADAVQIFDTWGGLLSDEKYSELVLPHVRKICDSIKSAGGIPILFIRDSEKLLPSMRDSGADVISLGPRSDLEAAWKTIGDKIATQGNIDPDILPGSPASVDAATRALLSKIEHRPGHIVNLGHGVPPNARLDSVKALVEAVRGWPTGVL